MAICPTGAIEISGRELSVDNLFKLPAREAASSFDQLLNLMQSRRSIREFKDKLVGQETIL